MELVETSALPDEALMKIYIELRCQLFGGSIESARSSAAKGIQDVSSAKVSLPWSFMKREIVSQ